MSTKIALGVGALVILTVVAVLFIPEISPLYGEVTHISLEYDSVPEYGSPLSNMSYVVRASVVKEKVNTFGLTKNQLMEREVTFNNKTLGFLQMINNINLTVAFQILITNETSGIILNQTKLLSDFGDRHFDLYIEPKLGNSFNITVTFTLTLSYSFQGQTFEFTKTVTKSKVIPVATVNNEMELG